VSDALVDVRRRRAVLQARSRIERARIASQAAGLLRPVGIADRASAIVRRLVSRPVWVLVMAAATVLVKPRRVLSWSGPLLAAWRVWRAWRGVNDAQGGTVR